MPKQKAYEIRRDFELELFRSNVARLYIKGWTQYEIAEELGVSRGKVKRSLDRIRARWQESALVDFNEAMNRELAALDALEREYWDAWERSKADAVEQENVKEQTPDGPRTREREKRKGQVGDPRFLEGIGKCREARIKLLGLAAPQKLDVTDNRERRTDELTDQQLLEIIGNTEPGSVE